MSETTLNHLPYLILALLLGMMGIAFVWHISLAGIRNEQRKSELQNQERMKAIECGYPLDQVKPVNAAVSIGVGVPGTAFGCAIVASLFSSNASHYAWPAAGAVGLAAVICGTLLALKSPQTPTQDFLNRKPMMEDDAYDVAGRRG